MSHNDWKTRGMRSKGRRRGWGWPRPCRVCGREFTPVRNDALTCSSTCRQHRHRGGDLAYLARPGLTAKEKRERRKWHDAIAEDIRAQKIEKAAKLKRRELNRQRRQERRAIEALGRAELERLRESGDYDAVVGGSGGA